MLRELKVLDVSTIFSSVKLQALCIVSTTVTVNSINFMSFSNVKTFNESDLIQDLNVRYAEWWRCWIWSPLNSALVAAITSNDEEWHDGPKASWTNHSNCFLICFHSTPYNSFHVSGARAHTLNWIKWHGRGLMICSTINITNSDYRLFPPCCLSTWILGELQHEHANRQHSLKNIDEKSLIVTLIETIWGGRGILNQMENPINLWQATSSRKMWHT